MDILKKLLDELKAKGEVRLEDKEKIEKLYNGLKESEQKEIKEYTEEVKALYVSDTDKEVEKAISVIVSKSVEKEVGALKDSVKKYLDDEKEKMTKKVGAYEPSVKEKRKELNKYVRSFCKGVITGTMTKELTTDDGASPYGGYAVSAELSQEIRAIKTAYGVAASEFTPMQLSKNSYKANELVTDVVTYWVDEAGSIKSSEVVLGQNTLELKKMAAIVGITSELLEDEDIDLTTFITKRVGESLAEREDNAFFNGDGTPAFGSFTGLLNSSYVNSVQLATGKTDFTDVTPDDLLDMIDGTPTGALKNGKFFMHRTIYTVLRKKKTTTGEYIFQQPTDGGIRTVDGYNIRLVEVMPTTGDTAVDTPFIIFGDLRQGCIYGYKSGIKAKRFDTGSIRNVADTADINLLTSDREAIRWTQRVGYFQVIQNGKKPITVLKTAAS